MWGFFRRNGRYTQDIKQNSCFGLKMLICVRDVFICENSLNTETRIIRALNWHDPLMSALTGYYVHCIFKFFPVLLAIKELRYFAFFYCHETRFLMSLKTGVFTDQLRIIIIISLVVIIFRVCNTSIIRIGLRYVQKYRLIRSDA